MAKPSNSRIVGSPTSAARKKRLTKVEKRCQELNSPEAVAERMGGLVRDPVIREPAKPPKVKMGDNGFEIGRGDQCPFCTHATNAHHPNCKLIGGSMELSPSLTETFDNGQLNRTEAKNG